MITYTPFDSQGLDWAIAQIELPPIVFQQDPEIMMVLERADTFKETS